jgi:hypothetical protein
MAQHNVGSQFAGKYDPIAGLDRRQFAGLEGKDKTDAVRAAITAKVNRDPSTRSQTLRLRNIYDATPAQVKEAGKQWYPTVHDAAQKAAREYGRPVRAAAGLVAAVSPSMDWEKHNISAFDEIGNLDHSDWDAIAHSSQGHTRHPDVTAMLAEKAPSLSHAPDLGLMKAHKIWHEGVDPDEVMPVQSAPKTNHFFHNILEPHKDTGATIDGRQADIAVDAMRPWTMGRGISSAATKRGTPTRYENYQNAVQRTAKHLGIMPHDLQATTWTHAKDVEKGFDPTRTKGDERLAQSYQSRIQHFAQGAGA